MIDNNKEFIICAANYYDNGEEQSFSPRNTKTGFVVCGRRHHNCINIFSRIVGFPYDEKGLELLRTEVQGFLTNKDRFVTRLEALEIARESGQIITGEGNPVLGLFSEDLY